jgi:recombination protein RecT
MSTTVAKAAPAVTGLKRFNQVITAPKTQEYLSKVLGAKSGAFVNNLTALVANNRMLQECDATSVMYAGIKATALDLPLDQSLGLAYVLPYKNTKAGVTEAQFQIGYKGFMQLAMRSGQIRTINVRDVREGEVKGEDFVSGEMKFEKLSEEQRANATVVGYLAFIRLTNGFEKMLYMTTEEMKRHASRYSQSYSSKNEYVQKSSPWTTDFDAMAKKTVLKQLLSKYAPMSVLMAEGIKVDQAVLGSDKWTTWTMRRRKPAS